MTWPGGKKQEGKWRITEARIRQEGQWIVTQYHLSPLKASNEDRHQ
jgi:hypothetical protein